MKIELTKNNSSIIEKVTYYTESKELIVEYAGNARYKYKDVPLGSIHDYIDAESKGKYINSIKNDYEVEKLENEVIGTAGQPSHLI
tara:strand:- start:1758 stop:2015 length:258 start_codon:yes stop_codon:yes gene_type:complete